MFPEVVVNSLSEAWRCWTAHLRCSAERMAAFYRKTKTRFPSPRVELTSHVSANGTLKLSCMQVNSDKSKVNHRCSTKPDSSHDSEMKTLRDDSSTARATKTSVSLVCVVRSSTRFCRRCGTLTRVRCSNSVVVPSSKNCHSCVVFVALHGGKICNFVTEGEKKNLLLIGACVSLERRNTGSSRCWWELRTEVSVGVQCTWTHRGRSRGVAPETPGWMSSRHVLFLLR